MKKMNRERVFVVSADPVLRAKLRKRLARDRVEIEEVDSGAQLLKILGAAAKVDLVLVDIHLPDVDGINLIKLLKMNTVTATIPVLAMTSADPLVQAGAVIEGAEATFLLGQDPVVFVRQIRKERQRYQIPALPPHFREVELLGVGGLADVYRAYDENRQRSVVLKVLRNTPVALKVKKTFDQNTDAFPELTIGHRAISRVIDKTWTENGEQVLVIEAAKGKPLRDMMSAIPTGVAGKVVRTIGSLRKKGVGLRYLCPSHVLVGPKEKITIDVGLHSLPRDIVNIEAELPYLDIDSGEHRLLDELNTLSGSADAEAGRFDRVIAAPALKTDEGDKEGLGSPSKDDSFYWNTRFPEDAAVLKSRVLVLGTAYKIETALETKVDGLSTAVAKACLPPKTRIVFELRAEGACLGTSGDHNDSVRSDEIEIGPNGTASFCTVLVPESASVILRLTLYKGAANVAGQSIRFRAVAPFDDSAGPTQPLESPVVSSGALATGGAHVRLEVERRGEKFCIRVEGGARVDKWIPAHLSAAELVNTAIRLRSRLVKLSEAYTPDSAAEFRIATPVNALETFCEIGAEMHEAFFGNPLDAAVSRDLKAAAEFIALAGRLGGARMQVVAEHLPFPWAIMYDKLVYENSSPGPADALTHFWGARFRIDRKASGSVSNAPSPVLGKDTMSVTSCINPYIDEEQEVDVVENQKAMFSEIAEIKKGVVCIGSCQQFEDWLHHPAACDLLYFFCHASSAKTVDELFFRVGTAPEVQANLFLDKNGTCGIDVKRMRTLHIAPLPGEPFVFLNACSSTAGDQAFQSLFLSLFMSTWQARGFLGTDWKVPAVFADAFSRRVLQHFIKKGVTIADALGEATQKVLAEKNPFPFIYALYAQPELRVA
jgi:CheY-like chemotaxis protein